MLPEQDTKHPDPGKCGGVLDHPASDGTSGKTSAIEANLTVSIHQAAEAAKAQGKLSSNMESLISDITDPKVDWKTVLARFLRANNKSDFSWVRPNRRFIGRGMYLPSLHNPCLEEIAIAVDTSGSTKVATSSIISNVYPSFVFLFSKHYSF
mgnify:CR=1 FL=1